MFICSPCCLVRQGFEATAWVHGQPSMKVYEEPQTYHIVCGKADRLIVTHWLLVARASCFVLHVFLAGIEWRILRRLVSCAPLSPHLQP